MMKLTSMRVLLVGLRGVGVEVAKNAILAGVHAMTLHDNEKTEVNFPTNKILCTCVVWL